MAERLRHFLFCSLGYCTRVDDEGWSWSTTVLEFSGAEKKRGHLCHLMNPQRQPVDLPHYVVPFSLDHRL